MQARRVRHVAPVELAPQDIDQLKPGQEAGLKCSAFNQRVTPELNGNVKEIAADLSLDERSGAGFYTVRIAIARSELKKLKGLTLAPGMRLGPDEILAALGAGGPPALANSRASYGEVSPKNLGSTW